MTGITLSLASCYKLWAVPRESQKTSSDLREPTLFGPAEQPDLFGSPPQQARYVPKPEHVRSGLLRLLERLTSAENWWSWSDWDIERYRDRDVRYYCDLLPDPQEREEWRGRFAVEIARLDAASAETRPEDPHFRRARSPSPSSTS
jgi:hypothetical protein